MAKIKFTKGELKRQRDSLKQFRRYLPTLQLKKQQLQSKILEARKELAGKMDALNAEVARIERWTGLLSDTRVDLEPWITPTNIRTARVNIAGASVPIFEGIDFTAPEYDLYETPLWIDAGIEQLRSMVSLMAEAEVIRRQIAILEQELRVTTQRVNLFEKVKIPECQDNIRKIRIYLGDQQANAVGISKVAKKKVEERAEEAVA